MTPPIFFYWFAAVTCLEFSFFFFLLFIYVSRQAANAVFGLLSLCFGGMIWSTYEMVYASSPASGLFWYRVQLASIAFSIATAANFVRLLTDTHKTSRRLHALTYGIGLAFSIGAWNGAVLHLPEQPVPVSDFDTAMAGSLYLPYFLCVFGGATAMCFSLYRALRRIRPSRTQHLADYSAFTGQLVWLLLSFILLIFAGFIEFLQALDFPTAGLDFYINPRALAALIFCVTTAWNLAKQAVADQKHKQNLMITAQTRLEATRHIQHQVRNALVRIERPLMNAAKKTSENDLSDKNRDRIERALSEMRELHQTLDVALNSARLEVGEPLNFGTKVSVSLETFVESLCQSRLKDEAEMTGKTRQFDLQTELEFPCAMLHEGPLREICVVLLENALKYSNPGTPIIIRIWNGQEKLWFRFTDQGCGLLPEDTERIFARFRVTQAFETPVAGTGIGLALAKCYVEALEGEIWAESAGQNRGSSFLFSLPYQPASASN